MTPSARLRVITNAYNNGRRRGRADAAAEFDSRLAKLERELREVREQLAREQTQVIVRASGPDHG